MAVGRIPGVAWKAARRAERLALSSICRKVGTLNRMSHGHYMSTRLDTVRLRQGIRAIYARVTTKPSSEFNFHRGPAYAAERLGYDSTALARLPSERTASFAGVANPLRIAALTPDADSR